jgi:GNAT superfamily N-acetyltransferase
MRAIPTAVPGLTLRHAAADDAARVLAFVRKLADYERLAHEVQAGEADFRAALSGARPLLEAVFAEEQGRALGFALFFPTFSTFAGKPGLYLEDLYVEPEARGRGCGRALLAYLGRLAVERGCTHVEWSVLDWNEPALAFYRGLGAQPVQDWTLYRLKGEALERLVRGE